MSTVFPSTEFDSSTDWTMGSGPLAKLTGRRFLKSDNWLQNKGKMPPTLSCLKLPTEMFHTLFQAKKTQTQCSHVPWNSIPLQSEWWNDPLHVGSRVYVNVLMKPLQFKEWWKNHTLWRSFWDVKHDGDAILVHNHICVGVHFKFLERLSRGSVPCTARVNNSG